VSTLDRFVEQLCELELEPELLRSDPRGERWLPASLRQMVEDDPACARELAEFVAMELELHDVHEPSDAFFTRQVLDRLPASSPELRIDDQRRTWILASAYALAIGVAYLLLGPLLSSGAISSFIAPVHDWYHDRAVGAGGMWIALALLGTTCVVTLAPTRRVVE
jgi:anti-sigma factor RsiW